MSRTNSIPGTRAEATARASPATARARPTRAACPPPRDRGAAEPPAGRAVPGAERAPTEPGLRYRRNHRQKPHRAAMRLGAIPEEPAARMLQITESAVMEALRHVQEPELGGDLVTRNMVRDLRIDGAKVAFQIELTTPACPLKDEIESRVHA